MSLGKPVVEGSAAKDHAEAPAQKASSEFIGTFGNSIGINIDGEPGDGRIKPIAAGRFSFNGTR